MAKKDKSANVPTPDEVEAIFADVDETGHTNASKARKEHGRRRARKAAVEVDPLSGDDPSGSSVGKVMTRTAVVVVAIMLVLVVLSQVACGLVRRAGTSQLAEHVDSASVSLALKNGVEWGDGFTQFPEDFSVQEADENTGTVEVTVIDTTSEDALECFAGSQVQASAFSVNCLLNPNINTVIYHVNVHMDENGKFKTAQLFGFLKPTGDVTSFITFVWSKTQSSTGVNFNCSITGVDETLEEELRDQVTTSFTPVAILNDLTGGSSTESDTSTSSDSANSGSGSGAK